MKWIDEILNDLRQNEKIIGISPKHIDVAYWFLFEDEWCWTYMGNVDVDWAEVDLAKLNHPERYFELMNDAYKYGFVSTDVPVKMFKGLKAADFPPSFKELIDMGMKV